MRILGHENQPTDSEWRRYFTVRRDQKISERTLRKEFFQLKKLGEANHWPWPFVRDDAPFSEEEPDQPTHRPEDLEQMIAGRDKLSKGEVFYLAAATTWGLRREEMARIQKRDYDEDLFTVHHAKKQRTKTRPIPDALKPIFVQYRAAHLTPEALSAMYHRICRKTGIVVKRGFGWHSLRRTVKTVLEWECAAHSWPLALVADYMGWSKVSRGIVYSGSAMAGVYSHDEIMSKDPYYIYRLLDSEHRYLKLWSGQPKKKEKTHS